MSSRPFESPPPYDHGSVHYSQPASYAPSREPYKAGSRELYNEDMRSQPVYSYYPGDEVQHFYKWSSPPGVIKILSILIIVMCIGIFACVASTLPWDLQLMGNTGLGSGMSGTGYGNSYGMGNSYNYGYAFGYGGNYMDPRSAKGFILAMSALCFIFTMVVFIILVSKGQSFRTRKFYLIVLILCAVLGALMLIATIVYVVAVNPMAQSAGSSFYYQIVALCNQFYIPAASGVYTNQYLYHYCVVEPQEAIAIVLGFLVVACLAVIIFFAVKVRKAIGYYGKMNILWEKGYMEEEQSNPNVEEWVKNVSGVPTDIPEIASYPERADGSINYPMHDDIVEDRAALHSRTNGTTPVRESEIPLMNNYPHPINTYSSSSDATAKKPAQRRPPRKRKAGQEKTLNSEGYDTDYTTGAESCDELEDDDLDRLYPVITSDQQRQAYKQEFDSGLQEYKQLQVAMDDVNKRMSDINSQLDHLHEDSEEYQALAEEYNIVKDSKLSADYRQKKRRCKELKGKLAHIKQLVSDYDSQKS